MEPYTDDPNKHVQGQNPYHAGYDQPTPPPYRQVPAGYAPAQEYGPPQPQVSYGPVGSTTNNTVVVQQTAPMAPIIMTQPMPSDNMVWSVLTCLFCFCPTGLAAIICSCQAQSAIAAGDVEEARARSRNAMQLSIASLVIGILTIVLFIILVFAVGIFATKSMENAINEAVSDMNTTPYSL